MASKHTCVQFSLAHRQTAAASLLLVSFTCRPCYLVYVGSTRLQFSVHIRHFPLNKLILCYRPAKLLPLLGITKSHIATRLHNSYRRARKRQSFNIQSREKHPQPITNATQNLTLVNPTILENKFSR